MGVLRKKGKSTQRRERLQCKESERPWEMQAGNWLSFFFTVGVRTRNESTWHDDENVSQYFSLPKEVVAGRGGMYPREPWRHWRRMTLSLFVWHFLFLCHDDDGNDTRIQRIPFNFMQTPTLNCWYRMRVVLPSCCCFSADPVSSVSEWTVISFSSVSYTMQVKERKSGDRVLILSQSQRVKRSQRESRKNF